MWPTVSQGRPASPQNNWQVNDLTQGSNSNLTIPTSGLNRWPSDYRCSLLTYWARQHIRVLMVWWHIRLIIQSAVNRFDPHEAFAIPAQFKGDRNISSR